MFIKAQDFTPNPLCDWISNPAHPNLNPELYQMYLVGGRGTSRGRGRDTDVPG